MSLCYPQKLPMSFTKFSKYHQEETSETKIAFTAAKLPGGGPRIPIVLPCWIWLWKRTREEYPRQRSREAEKERRVAWVACGHIRMILSSSRIGIALWNHFGCFSFRHNSLYDPVLQLQDAYVFLLFGLSPWRLNHTYLEMLCFECGFCPVDFRMFRDADSAWGALGCLPRQAGDACSAIQTRLRQRKC